MVALPHCKRCGHLKVSHRGACVALDDRRDRGLYYKLCECPEYQDPEEPDRVEP